MKIISRFSWLIVVCAALILSGWNLLVVGHSYGLPYPIAAIVSLVFDGTAFVAATLALGYSANGDSGFSPRMVVVIMASASAYLGSQHAVIAHDPAPARMAFGLPSLAAITLAELHMRWTRRNALRRQDRLPAQLPRFGKEAWLLFPSRTLRTLRRVIGYRLTAIESHISGSDPAPVLSIVPAPQRETATASELRAWARARGMGVGATGRIPQSVRVAYELEHGERKEITP